MPQRIIVKDTKYYFKIRGLGGPKGDKGDTGPAGPQGPQGPYVNVTAGTTTTLPAGSSAQVIVNNVGNTSVLNFGIPKGDTGAKGDKGDKGNTGPQGPQGPQGNTGPAGLNATVTVGTTTTGAPGTQANVVNSGTGNQAVLDFTIPQGAKGDKGDTGSTGPAGPTGPTGPQGPRGYTGSVKSTVVSELPETGDGDTYYLVNRTAEEHTATTTDGYVQINNTENAGDLTLTQLQGNATQETLSGKNLMPIESEDMTSARDHYFNIALNAGTYTISYDLSNVALGTNTSFAIYMALAGASAGGTTVDIDISGEITSTASTHKVKTFTITGNSNPSQQSNIRVASTNWNNGARAKISNIQIESGSTATAFEPYCGGVPSPNPSYPQAVNVVSGAQTVKITGKNLLDWEDSNKSASQNYTNATLNELLDNGVIITGNASSSAEHAFSRGWYMPTAGSIGTPYRVHLYQASTITVSADITLLELGNTAKMKIYVSDGRTNITSPVENQNIVLNQKVRLSQTFNNVPAGDWFPDFTLNSNKVKIENILVQLGNQATDYEPYQSQSQEINLGSLELAKIGTYQDYIWNDGGTWYIRRAIGKVVLNGGAGTYNSDPVLNWFYITAPSGILTDSPVISDYFTGTTVRDMMDRPTANGLIAVTSNTNILLRNTACTDTATYKTWLSTHPTTVYYALATPTDTAITDSDLIDQLDALAPASMFEGINNVMLIPSAGVQGELALSYVIYDKYNQHQVYIWSSDDNTWQIILP